MKQEVIYKDTEFNTAKDKQLTVKQFERFVKSLLEDFGKTYTDRFGNEIDVCFKYFSKRVYEHLHLHCGFIAHYDRFNFYCTYFNGDVDNFESFCKHFLVNGEERPYISPENNDINFALSLILKENYGQLYKIFNEETRGTDLITIKTLIRKHNFKEKDILGAV